MQDGDSWSERALVRGGAVLYLGEGSRDIEEALFFGVWRRGTDLGETGHQGDGYTNE